MLSVVLLWRVLDTIISLVMKKAIAAQMDKFAYCDFIVFQFRRRRRPLSRLLVESTGG